MDKDPVNPPVKSYNLVLPEGRPASDVGLDYPRHNFLVQVLGNAKVTVPGKLPTLANTAENASPAFGRN